MEEEKKEKKPKSTERIDKIICEKFGVSRTLAQKYVKSGIVYIMIEKKDNLNQKYMKEAQILKVNEKIRVKDIDNIFIKEEDNKYTFVSQGALKLEKAVKEFDINISKKTAIDMGASTGGFSEILLLNDAQKVFAIDVGTKQISPKLEKFKNLTVYENTDIRDVLKIPEIKNEKIDIMVGDLSFISLNLIYETIKEISPAELVLLIKPQFEIGKQISKTKGVVKDPKLIKIAISNVLKTYKETYLLEGITYSPLISKKTNLEFLVYLKLRDKNNIMDKEENNRYNVRVLGKIETVIKKAINEIQKQNKKEQEEK